MIILIGGEKGRPGKHYTFLQPAVYGLGLVAEMYGSTTHAVI